MNEYERHCILIRQRRIAMLEGLALDQETAVLTPPAPATQGKPKRVSATQIMSPCRRTSRCVLLCACFPSGFPSAFSMSCSSSAQRLHTVCLHRRSAFKGKLDEGFVKLEQPMPSRPAPRKRSHEPSASGRSDGGECRAGCEV